MKKYTRLLLEGLFDDFDELFQDTDDVMDTLNDTVYKINSLTECSSIDDINMFLMEKYDLIGTIKQCCSILETNFDKYRDDIKKAFQPLMQSGKINRLDIYEGSYYNDYKSYIELRVAMANYGINLKFVKDQTDFPELVYRNKPTHCHYLYFTADSKIKLEQIPFFVYTYKRTQTSNSRWSTSQKTYVPIETGDHPKLQEAKRNYNVKLYQDLDNKIEQFLLDYFKQILKTDTIFQELEVEGKVYPVVQKDYMRMSALFDGDRREQQILNGFDKIKKPEKLLARIAAYFIAAKNLGKRSDQLILTDDLILNYLFGIDYGWTSRGASFNSLTNEILLRLKSFPTLHLKDVIATYMAYKDKF